MATDATGAPSTLFSIPKFNVNADAPSGLGGNAQIDAIDALLANLGIAGLVANDVPVYDSVAGKFKKATGTPSSSTFLRGDGSWATVGSSGLTQIFDSTLGASAASFDITPIAQTFNHLRLMMYLRGDDVASLIGVNIRFNNDSAANYDYQYESASAGVSSPAESFGNNAGQCAVCPAASAGANLFGGAVVDIPHYTGNVNNKTYEYAATTKAGTASGNMVTRSGGGFWRSNAAITRITIVDNSGGNFVAGSRVTLYGIT